MLRAVVSALVHPSLRSAAASVACTSSASSTATVRTIGTAANIATRTPTTRVTTATPLTSSTSGRSCAACRSGVSFSTSSVLHSCVGIRRNITTTTTTTTTTKQSSSSLSRYGARVRASSAMTASAISSSRARGMASSTGDARSREGNPDKIAFALMNVTKKLPGGRQLFGDLSLSFLDGAKIGILGVNGSGKSSLLKIIAGVDKEFQGEARAAPGYRVGYLPQEPVLDASKTVMENVMEGLKHKFDLVKQFDEISAKFAEPDADMDKLMEEQSELQSEIERLECWDLTHKIEIAMDALRCPPPDSSVVNLSGGERRRVALARLLLSQPDILLLDEPTNHLDAESVAWLEKFLDTYRGLVVAITHDRYFLDNVVGWILEVDHGKGYPFRGNYQQWLENKHNRLTLDAKKEVKAAKILERELTWLRRNSSAVTKGKARVAKIHDMQAQREQSRLSKRSEGGALVIPQGPRLGQEAISVTGLAMEMDGRRLFSGVNFRIDEGNVLGVIGPNGSGKTTLIRVLTGDMQPAEGHVKIGDTVQFAYNKQTREQLNDDNSVWKEICGDREYIDVGPDNRILARAYVAQFNFGGTDQQKKVHQLSGGERNRAQLAKSLAQGANVILLDEPTNDLDVGTLRALEEALTDFDGAALIVSHDRYFLDRVATHILAFDEFGNHTYSVGNYSEWERTHRGKDHVPGKGKKFKKVA